MWFTWLYTVSIHTHWPRIEWIFLSNVQSKIKDKLWCLCIAQKTCLCCNRASMEKNRKGKCKNMLCISWRMHVRLQQWHLFIYFHQKCWCTLLQTLYINGSPTVKRWGFGSNANTDVPHVAYNTMLIRRA